MWNSEEMSNNVDDKEEPMDTSEGPSELPQASGTSSQEEDKVLITVSVKWLESHPPQKLKPHLQRCLQSWFNNMKTGRECSVLRSSEDGTFDVEIQPAPAQSDVQELKGQTLTNRDGISVTIMSVSLTPSQQEDASVNLPSSFVSESQNVEQKSLSSAAAVSPAGEETSPKKLQELNGQTLISKDTKTVTMFVSSTPQLQMTEIPEGASVNLPPSSMSDAHDQMHLLDQNGLSSAAVSAAGEETCFVPVGHFWYMSHIYKEEIKRIEKENGIKIKGEVKVTFEPHQGNGDAAKAFSEFTDLAQKCLGETNGSVVSLKFVDPDRWSDTMKIIQKNDNKVLLTLSSEEMILCGPRQSQEAISKSINATQKILNSNSSVRESAWTSEDTSLKINMNIKDPLVDSGLTIEQSHWKLMTASFSEYLAKIQSKFGVDIKVSQSDSEGKLNVRVCYKGPGGNTSMESHAVRALLRLCQKITTSPMGFTQFQDASGFSDSPMNLSNDHESAGASSDLVFGGQSEYSKYGNKASTGKETARDNKEEKCPICMDAFTNKKQLKCKHEFCDDCLKQSEKSMGPVCPVCKDVFGVIEGDQPMGTMTWKTSSFSLPGFSKCGTIEINYDIPSGIQTKKHPKPGEQYYGIYRKAYLPDNTEGKEVLQLLKKAFDQRLIFTVGTSRTTGRENQVTWNDIHHKTSISGGPVCFGYPDPGYLSRVRDELKAKGIK